MPNQYLFFSKNFTCLFLKNSSLFSDQMKQNDCFLVHQPLFSPAIHVSRPIWWGILLGMYSCKAVPLVIPYFHFQVIACPEFCSYGNWWDNRSLQSLAIWSCCVWSACHGLNREPGATYPALKHVSMLQQSLSILYWPCEPSSHPQIR